MDMLKFWDERKKDLKARNARRARELAAKHFAWACPVRFAEQVFPGIQLLGVQKKLLCLMHRNTGKRFIYTTIPRNAGRGVMLRILQAHRAQLQGAVS